MVRDVTARGIARAWGIRGGFLRLQNRSSSAHRGRVLEMQSFARIFVLAAFALVACALSSSTASAQTFNLDPTSVSQAAIPATSGDLLITSAAIPPSAPPPPAVALTAAQLGL